MTGSTLAELKELYVNRGFENVEGKNNWRIPTLEEYLIAFRGKDCRLFIELKSDQKGLVEAVRDPGQPVRYVRAGRRHNLP